MRLDACGNDLAEAAIADPHCETTDGLSAKYINITPTLVGSGGVNEIGFLCELEDMCNDIAKMGGHVW